MNQPTETPAGGLTSRQAAQLLDLPLREVYRLSEAGVIGTKPPGVRMAWRYEAQALRDWTDSGRKLPRRIATRSTRGRKPSAT